MKKINHFINDWPPGTVYLSAWLKQRGISGQLLNRYKQSGWIQSVGSGAVKRVGDHVGYQGALYALQFQRNSSIHVGGKSALELQGRLHYLKLKTTAVCLFGDIYLFGFQTQIGTFLLTIIVLHFSLLILS